jgi:putative transposase
MKRKRFTEEQIIAALKEVDGGAETRDVCRRLGVTEQSFYRWRRKYGGLEVNDAKRLRELQLENGRLKRVVADLVLDNQMLRDVNSKKW